MDLLSKILLFHIVIAAKLSLKELVNVQIVVEQPFMALW